MNDPVYYPIIPLTLIRYKLGTSSIIIKILLVILLIIVALPLGISLILEVFITAMRKPVYDIQNVEQVLKNAVINFTKNNPPSIPTRYNNIQMSVILLTYIPGVLDTLLKMSSLRALRILEVYNSIRYPVTSGITGIDLKNIYDLSGKDVYEDFKKMLADIMKLKDYSTTEAKYCVLVSTESGYGIIEKRLLGLNAGLHIVLTTETTQEKLSKSKTIDEACKKYKCIVRI